MSKKGDKYLKTFAKWAILKMCLGNPDLSQNWKPHKPFKSNKS